ncbi:MAG: 50S ribosomal protein L9 [Magnetovibrio sp.]|nr:50S ribosomal protein L9 [Magnetovibrio sp.]
MEVILLERIEKLGQMGDVVNVKPGYARNFLLPREKALRATDANKARFESQRAQLEAENLKLREEADAVGTKLNGTSVILIRQAGEAGQLYGSVNARDIAASVTEAGFTVNRNQVKLVDPIKTLGLFEVTVALHPEVSVTVSVNVARSADEAAIQAETGHAVTGGDDEADAEAAAELEAVFEEGAAEAAAEELAAEEAANAEAAPAEEAGEEEAE